MKNVWIWMLSVSHSISSNWFASPVHILLKEGYSEPCQTAKMETFAKIVHGLSLIVNGWS